MIYMKNKALFI